MGYTTFWLQEKIPEDQNIDDHQDCGEDEGYMSSNFSSIGETSIHEWCGKTGSEIEQILHEEMVKLAKKGIHELTIPEEFTGAFTVIPQYGFSLTIDDVKTIFEHEYGLIVSTEISITEMSIKGEMSFQASDAKLFNIMAEQLYQFHENKKRTLIYRGEFCSTCHKWRNDPDDFLDNTRGFRQSSIERDVEAYHKEHCRANLNFELEVFPKYPSHAPLNQRIKRDDAKKKLVIRARWMDEWSVDLQVWGYHVLNMWKAAKKHPEDYFYYY